MSRTSKLVANTLLIVLRPLLLPLAAVAIGVVFGIIFRSWIIPVAVLAVVALLMVLNRILRRPRGCW